MFYVMSEGVEYSDPWLLSAAKRLVKKCKKSKNIVYFYERPDNSTFRYRVYNMIQAIDEIDMISATYFGLDDRQYFDDFIELADVLIICRTRYCDSINYIISRARLKGIKVIFDVDDLVFDVSYLDLVLDTLDQDITHPEVWDHWFAYVGRIGHVLKLCDGCITTNNYLGEKLREYSGLEYEVIPNFLNKEQLSISKAIYDEKLSSNFQRTDDINIGYFSGTPSHNKDFAILVDALQNLFVLEPRVKLRVVGYLDIPKELQEYSSRIEIYPFHDFINLQRIMSLSEINVVPLQNNNFTNCKSELKYFEASVVGTITIATPIYTYESIISHGEDGFLAQEHEWLYFLKKAIAIIDKDNSKQMAQKSMKKSIDKYAFYNQKSLLKSTLSKWM